MTKVTNITTNIKSYKNILRPRKNALNPKTSINKKINSKFDNDNFNKRICYKTKKDTKSHENKETDISSSVTPLSSSPSYCEQKSRRISTKSKKIAKKTDNLYYESRIILPNIGITQYHYDSKNYRAHYYYDDEICRALKVLNDRMYFLEDQLKYTRNYSSLKLKTPNNNQSMSFNCYQDNELNIPSEFVEKTIKHKYDNDCSTDEDQIRGAKKILTKALDTYLSEQRELDLKAKNVIIDQE